MLLLRATSNLSIVKLESVTLPACTYTGSFYTRYELFQRSVAQVQGHHAALPGSFKPNFAIHLDDGSANHPILLKQIIPPPTIVGTFLSDGRPYLSGWQQTNFTFQVHTTIDSKLCRPFRRFDRFYSGERKPGDDASD